MRFGAGKDKRGVVIMITLGTGIGCAVFHDGVLLPNTELGHIEIEGKDAERLASGSARDDEKLSWKEYGKRIQKYLRKVDALLWPDLFIIGGGVSKEADKYLPDIKIRTPVVIAELLNNAGIVGAATLVHS
jgi:polyphosphate glucokinase